MTTLGKLLVFLNLLTAVALVTWATSLTANRLDWVDRTDADGQKVEGEITKLTKQIAAASKAAADASAAYGQQEQALADAESGNDAGREGRDRRRAVYSERLAAARNGQFFEQRQLPGKVLIDGSVVGPAIIGPNGEPLEGVQVYQKRLDDAMKDSRAAAKRIEELRAKFAQLSTDILDTNGRILAQRTILANLTDEQKYLKSVQINWDEELRTLKTRRGQLERRIKAVAGDQSN